MAAKCLGRNYIGVDVSEEYNQIAKERLETELIYRKTVEKVSLDLETPLTRLL